MSRRPGAPNRTRHQLNFEAHRVQHGEKATELFRDIAAFDRSNRVAVNTIRELTKVGLGEAGGDSGVAYVLSETARALHRGYLVVELSTTVP